MLASQLADAMHDSEFMTAKEKAQVLKVWESFLRSLLEPDSGEKVLTDGGYLPPNKFRRFTKALYEHLHQRCGFIAHYDRAGFFAEYFLDPEDTIRFLRQFDRDHGRGSVEYEGVDWWLKGDCTDINNAMIDVFGEYKAALYEMLRAQAKAKDIAKAQALLAKHGVILKGMA